MDSQKREEYNHKNANYYNSSKLDYYKPDAFNQLDDPLETFHIQNYSDLNANIIEASLDQIISYITIFEEVIKNISTHKTKILQILHLALPLVKQKCLKIK